MILVTTQNILPIYLTFQMIMITNLIILIIGVVAVAELAVSYKDGKRRYH